MITKVLKPIGTWLIKANTKTTTRLIKKLIAALVQMRLRLFASESLVYVRDPHVKQWKASPYW